MKKFFITLLVFLNIFVLQFNFTFAKSKKEKNKKQQTFELEEIVVSASKINQLLKTVPASVTVINENEIKNSYAKNLGEIMEDKVGIEVRNNGALGNLSQAYIRGTTEKQTLILVDGQPLNSSQNGGVDLNQIDLNLVEKIEIVKGAFSSVYGANALGGIINIIPKKQAKDKVMVSSSIGNFNTLKGDLSIEKTFKDLNFSFSTTTTTTDGIRNNDNYAAQNYAVQLGNKKNTLNFLYYFYKSKKGVPGDISYPSDTAKENDEKQLAQFNITNNFNKGRNLSLKTYFQKDTIKYNDSLLSISDVHNPQTIGFDMKFSQENNNKFVLGLEYKNDKLKSTTIGEKTFNNWGIYGNLLQEFGKKTFLLIGFRNDKHSFYESEFSPRIGVTFNLKKNIALKTSYGKGFRTPTFNDLYWPLKDYADPTYGFGESGNANLKPEKGETFDLILETTLSKTNFKINYFNINTKNLINWTATYDANHPYGFWTPNNVDNAILKGIESEINFIASKKTNLNLNYQYLDARNKNTKKFLLYRPFNTLNISLDYLFNQDLSLNITGKYLGRRRYLDADNTKNLPSYFNLQAKLEFKVNNNFIYLKGDNLLNKNYQEVAGYPMPKRYLEVGLKKVFK